MPINSNQVLLVSLRALRLTANPFSMDAQNTNHPSIVDNQSIDGLFSPTCQLLRVHKHDDSRITGSKYDMYKELKRCRLFPQITIKCFSHPFAEDNLEITVYEDTIFKLSRLLKEKTGRNSNSYTKTIRLYALLRVLNIIGLYHVDKKDLIALLGGGRKKSFNKALEDLETLNLVKSFTFLNKKTGHYYNAYCAQPYDCEVHSMETVVVYKYESSLLKYIENLKDVYIDEAWIDVNQNNPRGQVALSYTTTFIRWYDELDYTDQSALKYAPKPAHFSQKNGRLYHLFHDMHKEDREKTILWEGEYIVEHWDANASFFLSMSYMLLNKEFEDEHIQNMIQKEARIMAELCLQGKFYDKVLTFYNQNAKYGKDREEIKKLCQKYKTRWRSYYLRKDGEYKQYKYLNCIKFVDMFFAKQFPYIRDYILDSEVIVEENPDAGKVLQGWNEQRYKAKDTKKVLLLDREVMPFEFKLISEGICKMLYEEYGIKSITVHDAIYMKKTDASLCPDIDTILRRLLNLPTPHKPTIFNPAYSDGIIVTEPSMYRFNLNTPNSTQLRVS